MSPVLPKRVICLWRMVNVWHESVRQRPQDIRRTLIACNTRHRLRDRDIVNGQRWGRGVVVSRLVIRCSNVAHFVLTLQLQC